MLGFVEENGMGAMRRVAAMTGLGAALLMVGCQADPQSQVDRALQQMEAQEPVFALIRENEPAAYQDMRSLIERTIRQNGQPDSQQLIQRSRAILARAIERRVQTAPDAMVRDLVRFVADQSQSLESSPRVCVDLLNGTAGDIRGSISPEMQQRERKLYEDLLRTPQDGQKPIASEAVAREALGGFMTDAQDALGLNAAQVENGLIQQGEPLQICRVMGYMMRRISELPPAESAALFRFLGRQAAQARPPSPLG